MASMQIILTESTLFIGVTYELVWSLVLRSVWQAETLFESNHIQKDIKI